jgi:hypothetical protein
MHIDGERPILPNTALIVMGAYHTTNWNGEDSCNRDQGSRSRHFSGSRDV